MLLAYIRSTSARSHETYRSPRITRELQEECLTIGRRRTAQLMRAPARMASKPDSS